MVQVIHSTQEWNDALANAGNKAVVVDFFATWCGPCKMISPKFEELSTTNSANMVFLKVDVDECEEIAGQIAHVTAMPTFQVWQNGKLVDTLVGASPAKLQDLVTKHSAALSHA